MADNSHLTAHVAIPDEIREWNWGAFLLAPLWGIRNRVYVGLLAIIPLAGIVIAAILGIKGNEWAWRKRTWESPSAFRRLQRKWSYWGWGILISLTLLYIVLEKEIQVLWFLLYVLLVVWIFDTIFSKAGHRYSGGMSLLMLIPVLNVVAFIIFLVTEWPIERKMRDLRIRCGSADQEDANSLLAEAISLDAKGSIDQALLKYQEVIVRFRSTVAADDAAKSIAAFRSRSESTMEPSA